MARQLAEPVADSAATLIPELLRITVNGSWGGTMTLRIDGEDMKDSFTANFTESGQSFSGQTSTSGLVGSVSGTMNGYNIGFTSTFSILREAAYAT